jgi:hypothetical protein
MDQFLVEYRYSQHYDKFHAWVDIQLTLDKLQDDNVIDVFSTICDDAGLDDNYFQIESGRAASAMIKLGTLDGHSSCCRGCYTPEVVM